MSDSSPGKNPLRVYTVGFEFIVIFLLFVGAGVTLDKTVSKPPGFTVLGTIIGFGGGMYWLLKRVKEARKEFGGIKPKGDNHKDSNDQPKGENDS